MKLYTINATPVKDTDSNGAAGIKLSKYPQEVANILGAHGIEGFTMYQVQGYWMGTAEASFKIEIAIGNKDHELDSLYEVCWALRDEYHQDAVMLTNPDNSVEFI